MKQFNNLLETYFGKFTDEELVVLSTYFKKERIRKNDFFTKSGKICDKLSLVKSGILRVYALSDVKEVTQWISTENTLITEVMGFFFGQSNRWSIQAFTDVELLTISKSNYAKLCQEFPRWHEIEKNLIIKCFATIEDRIFAHLSMSAEERYVAYFDQHKSLFNQVPLQYIASVLGMTPETFSRIRKRLTAKS